LDQVANRSRPNLQGEGSEIFASQTPELFFTRCSNSKFQTQNFKLKLKLKLKLKPQPSDFKPKLPFVQREYFLNKPKLKLAIEPERVSILVVPARQLAFSSPYSLGGSA
jgi:hypothetical protein